MNTPLCRHMLKATEHCEHADDCVCHGRCNVLMDIASDNRFSKWWYTHGANPPSPRETWMDCEKAMREEKRRADAS